MAKTKVLFCKSCGRKVECFDKGKKDEKGVIVVPVGIMGTLAQISKNKRPTYWKCSKCGDIFEEN